MARTSTSPSARTTTRRTHRLLVIVLTVVIAAITAALGYPSRNSPDSSAAPLVKPVTVFDDEIPAVAHLNPDPLRALRQAAMAAAEDGAEFYVNSGRRSPEYQHRLLREAASTYGSEDEAARWVATTPVTSPHVSGDMIDIGHSDATAWLSAHGAEGLCQICRNEPWHCELRPDAIDRGCPRMYADPAQDPRMQQ
jgi:hypothetical protein